MDNAPQPTPVPSPTQPLGHHAHHRHAGGPAPHAPPGSARRRPGGRWSWHCAGSDFANDTGGGWHSRQGFLVAYPSGLGSESWQRPEPPGQAPGAPVTSSFLFFVSFLLLRRLLVPSSLPEEARRSSARSTSSRPRSASTRTRLLHGRVERRGHDRAARPATLRAPRRRCPVAGGYRSLPPCRPSRPLPVLEIHGTADQVVPYGGQAARLRRQREAVAVAVAAHRRLPGEGGSAATRARGDRDRLAPLQRRDARRARAPRRPGARLARRPADRRRRRRRSPRLADVAVLPQPPAAAARRVSA